VADTSAGDERRKAVLILARHVRVRFALDLEALADRALEIGRAAFPDGPWPDCLQRLSLDDLYLATACARGEDRAWEECAERFFGFIRDFAGRRLRGPEAGEVADRVMADLWQRGTIARFEGRSRLRTWLGAVVAHAAVNAAKAARPTVSWEGQAPGSRPEPATPGESGEVERQSAAALARFLEQALLEASDDDRLLLLLYYEQGLTLDEISAVQSGSKSSLSRRLTRLRTILRSRVEALAREQGASLADLRAGTDLSRIDFDLARLLRGTGWERSRGVLSKSMKEGAP
jgi:RNA polymerase sigma-70 factor, ECF subfamily